jgi:hypothetical protein
MAVGPNPINANLLILKAMFIEIYKLFVKTSTNFFEVTFEENFS